MSDFNFEVLPLRDILRIKHLGYQTYLPHYAHLWYNSEGIDWYLHKCFNEAQLALDLANPEVSYYCIRVNGEDAGLLKLVKNKAPLGQNPQTCLYLEKIYFLKSYTGLGLGQKTMRWVFEKARQSQFEQVWLMAMDSSHKTIESYKKAGFSLLAPSRLDDIEFSRLKSELRGMVILAKKI